MISNFFTALLRLFHVERAPERIELPDVSRARVRIPGAVLRELRRATQPTKQNHEPLAFLRVRYASEAPNGVIVAIGVHPFAQHAYVDGDAGANFDTMYAVEVANVDIRANAGLLLAHQHGGRGRPSFSTVDRETNRQVMLQLVVGVPYAPYGAIVLSDDSAAAVVARGGRLIDADVIVVSDGIGAMDTTA